MFNKAKLLGSAAGGAISNALASTDFFNAAKAMINSDLAEDRGKRSREIETYVDKKGRRRRRGNSGKIPMAPAYTRDENAKAARDKYVARVKATQGPDALIADCYLNSHARCRRTEAGKGMPDRRKVERKLSEVTA